MPTRETSLHSAFAEALSSFEGTRLGLAVSGGSDSVAMLRLATDWAAARGVKLSVCTVDHGLRADAAAEAEWVAQLASALGHPHETLIWQGDGQPGNLQARARTARYHLIADWAQRKGCSAVLLGHTCDDQAETVVMNLARAAGVDGLSAMAPRTRSQGMVWLRPLLTMRRAALRAYLSELGQPWHEDPSNADRAFQRVRVREALPLLEALGLSAEALSTVAENMQTAREALEAETNASLLKGDWDESGAFYLPFETFSAPAEILRRAVGHVIRKINGNAYPPRRAEMAQMRESLLQQAPFTLAGVVGFPDARRSRYGFAREFAAVQQLETAPDCLWDGRWQASGPFARGHSLKALGPEGLRQCAEFKPFPFPRKALLAVPAIWEGERLVAAPILDPQSAFTIKLCPAARELPVSH